VRWTSTFEPKRSPEAQAVGAISGVYQAGFDSLKGKFGGWILARSAAGGTRKDTFIICLRLRRYSMTCIATVSL
jgi:hypothetical protein